MDNEKAFSKDYNIIPDAISEFSKGDQLSVYKKMTEARVFEQCIVSAASTGKFPIKVHMSTGEESIAAALAVILPNYLFFTQHRTMDLFIALDGNPEELRDEIMCLDNGCCGGKIGGAFQIHNDKTHMYTHTGLIGENVSVGVGMALGSGKKTLCLFGDGAAEEDYVLTAYGFAATHKLPVLFVCQDNGLSVLSPLKKRRSWDLSKVCAAFGMKAIDVTDDPFTIMHWASIFDDELPALINVRTCRNYWHAGMGIDGPPAWNRYEIVTKQLLLLGYENEMEEINETATKRMKKIWKEYL